MNLTTHHYQLFTAEIAFLQTDLYDYVYTYVILVLQVFPECLSSQLCMHDDVLCVLIFNSYLLNSVDSSFMASVL